MSYEDRISDRFWVRIFWKRPNDFSGQFMQILVSEVSYTKFIHEVDRGITAIFYKVVDAQKSVHRINKYEIQNIVAWKYGYEAPNYKGTV